MVDAAAAADGADDVSLLLPLADFAAVLQDTVYAYARPDAAPQTVRFRHADDADHMLAILLSVLDIYDANAYLAHADDTTRQRLLRLLNFLLKVVPDDDPSLFVDDAVRAIKSLAARVPEEGTRSVTSALDALFRSLKLPQRFGLGFDDVEALGRKSRERQQELMRRRVLLSSSSSSSSSASGLDGASSRREYDALRAEMDRDDKFMLRMQLIVHAYLSHSRRGEEVPVFCSHVMALGRLGENHWSVKVAAVRSRGVHGLIRPETVHTFMPIILSDTTEYGAGTGREGVAVAAIGVVFDLIMEYGLRFFDTPSSTRGSHGATSSAAAVTMISTMHTNQNNNNNNNNSSSNNNNNNNTNSSNNDSNNNNYHDTDTNTDGRANRAIGTHEDRNVSHAPSPYSAPNEDGHAGDDDDGARRDADPASAIPSAGESLPVRHALGVRLHREQELAEEDVHKVGIRHLLRTLLSYMRPAETTRTPVTLLGFCKLLSCNRLPHDQVPLVLARLMLHYTRILHLHHEAPTLSAYLTDMLDRFFRSYAASHPRRQLAMANGGMAACQLVLAERHTSWALKLMEYVTRVTDAFALTHIRDIDPEIARRVHRTTALDESSMHTSACAASTNVSGTCTSTTTSCNNNHNNNNNNESNREDTGDEDTAQARSNRTSLSRTLRKSDSQHRTANRVAVARLSLQSGRLMRELSCYSLHELLAQELLLEMSENEDVGCGAVCMSVLERHMYFYSKEVQPGLIDATQRALKQWTRRRDDGARESFSSSSFLSSSSLPYGGNGHGGNPYAAHGNSDCSRDHRDGSRNEKVQAMEELCARLQRWQSEMENRFGAPSSSATTIQATNSGHTHHAPSASVEARWQLLLRQRREAVEQLRSDGYGSIASSPGENVAGGGRARSISPPPPPGLTMHTRAASERAGRSAGGGAALPRAVKREELPQSQTTSAVKRERGSDFFDVDAIMTTRTRPRHGG